MNITTALPKKIESNKITKKNPLSDNQTVKNEVHDNSKLYRLLANRVSLTNTLSEEQYPMFMQDIDNLDDIEYQEFDDDYDGMEPQLFQTNCACDDARCKSQFLQIKPKKNIYRIKLYEEDNQHFSCFTVSRAMIGHILKYFRYHYNKIDLVSQISELMPLQYGFVSFSSRKEKKTYASLLKEFLQKLEMRYLYARNANREILKFKYLHSNSRLYAQDILKKDRNGLCEMVKRFVSDLSRLQFNTINYFFDEKDKEKYTEYYMHYFMQSKDCNSCPIEKIHALGQYLMHNPIEIERLFFLARLIELAYQSRIMPVKIKERVSLVPAFFSVKLFSVSKLYLTNIELDKSDGVLNANHWISLLKEDLIIMNKETLLHLMKIPEVKDFLINKNVHFLYKLSNGYRVNILGLLLMYQLSDFFDNTIDEYGHLYRYFSYDLALNLFFHAFQEKDIIDKTLFWSLLIKKYILKNKSFIKKWVDANNNTIFHLLYDVQNITKEQQEILFECVVKYQVDPFIKNNDHQIALDRIVEEYDTKGIFLKSKNFSYRSASIMQNHIVSDNFFQKAVNYYHTFDFYQTMSIEMILTNIDLFLMLDDFFILQNIILRILQLPNSKEKKQVVQRIYHDLRYDSIMFLKKIKLYDFIVSIEKQTAVDNPVYLAQLENKSIDEQQLVQIYLIECKKRRIYRKMSVFEGNKQLNKLNRETYYYFEYVAQLFSLFIDENLNIELFFRILFIDNNAVEKELMYHLFVFHDYVQKNRNVFLQTFKLILKFDIVIAINLMRYFPDDEELVQILTSSCNELFNKGIQKNKRRGREVDSSSLMAMNCEESEISSLETVDIDVNDPNSLKLIRYNSNLFIAYQLHLSRCKNNRTFFRILENMPLYLVDEMKDILLETYLLLSTKNHIKDLFDIDKLKIFFIDLASNQNMQQVNYLKKLDNFFVEYHLQFLSDDLQKIEQNYRKAYDLQDDILDRQQKQQLSSLSMEYLKKYSQNSASFKKNKLHCDANSSILEKLKIFFLQQGVAYNFFFLTDKILPRCIQYLDVSEEIFISWFKTDKRFNVYFHRNEKIQ